MMIGENSLKHYLTKLFVMSGLKRTKNIYLTCMTEIVIIGDFLKYVSEISI